MKCHDDFGRVHVCIAYAGVESWEYFSDEKEADSYISGLVFGYYLGLVRSVA